MSTAYASLVASFTKLYRYQHLASIVAWDQAAMMPSKGNDARSAAMAELAVLLHETLTAPQLASALTAASCGAVSVSWRRTASSAIAALRASLPLLGIIAA